MFESLTKEGRFITAQRDCKGISFLLLFLVIAPPSCNAQAATRSNITLRIFRWWTTKRSNTWNRSCVAWSVCVYVLAWSILIIIFARRSCEVFSESSITHRVTKTKTSTCEENKWLRSLFHFHSVLENDHFSWYWTRLFFSHLTPLHTHQLVFLQQTLKLWCWSVNDTLIWCLLYRQMTGRCFQIKNKGFVQTAGKSDVFLKSDL